MPGTVAGPWDILFPFSSVGDENIGPLMYGPGTSKKQKKMLRGLRRAVKCVPDEYQISRCSQILVYQYHDTLIARSTQKKSRGVVERMANRWVKESCLFFF